MSVVLRLVAIQGTIYRMINQLKYPLTGDGTSKVARSAQMFRKLSKCIKAYNKPQVEKAISEVNELMSTQGRNSMRRNLKELVVLLEHKKDMLNSAAKTVSMKKPFPFLEASIRTQIEKTNCRLKRSSKLVRQPDLASTPGLDPNAELLGVFEEENKGQSNNIARAKVRTCMDQSWNSNPKHRHSCPRPSANYTQTEDLLAGMLKQFSRNPNKVTPDNLVLYYQLKKQCLDQRITRPSQDLFSSFCQTQEPPKQVPRVVSELQRSGTQIQNILDRCTDVLKVHLVNMKMTDDTTGLPNTKPHQRKFRYTFDLEAGNRNCPKKKYSRQSMMRLNPRRTYQEQLKRSRSNGTLEFGL